MNTDLALADSGRETSGSSRSTSSETDEWEPVVEGAETGQATTNWDKSPRINSPWTLSPRVVVSRENDYDEYCAAPGCPIAVVDATGHTGIYGPTGRSATTGTPPAVNPTSPSPPLASPNLPTDAALGLSPNQNQSTSHLHLHLPSLHRHSPATDDAPSTAARLGGILRRRRSNGAGTGPSHRLRLVPHLDPQARTLHFEPIVREVKAGGPVLRIGRFTERVVTASRQPDSTKIAFKSKVVSRAHAEIWCAPSGKFMIRDTRSSSGTFLNHTRLSAPNIESRPTELHDGDIVQLGVDYQGGAEEIYRCVKIRVEVGREWQREANEFNTGALKQLQTLQGRGTDSGKEKAKDKPRTSTPSVIAGPSNSRKTSVADCCISRSTWRAVSVPFTTDLTSISFVDSFHFAGLFPVGILQSLFIAPCSHCFHYKCIRPLLIKHHPGFSCPLCRTFADLEEDVEQEYAPSVHARVSTPRVFEPPASMLRLYMKPRLPEHGTKDLPPVPGDEASGSMTRQSTLDTGSDRLRPESTHSGPPHNSDGGSTPRGSSEDLRAAQRGLFDSTLVSDEPEDELVRVPGGIIVPRSPDREHDIFNSYRHPLEQPVSHSDRAQRRRIGPSFYPFRGGHPCPPPHLGIRIQRRLGHTLPSQDTESAKHILVDDEEDDNDKEDDDALVIDSMKRMSVATETEAGPSSQVKKI
ncbi:SMAD FHA protein [Rhizoctonia solani]|uniref:SMAD FHA protein n=1 Tax=Rhizoctonia solani TaxID=456999 RepID=A0A8H7I595_9AGAM|nr:SMAD FHA protein [Rhizoctonia solani]